MRNPFRRDLILLHAPALFDFRTHETFLGPMADAVPSTPMFEMYRDYIEAVRDYWIARSDLDRAAGGRLTGPTGPTARPPEAAAPPSSTAPMPMQHEMHKH